MAPETTEPETRVIIKGDGRHGVPLDVFASITAAIGVLYPNAMMGPGEHGQGVALILGPGDRRRTVKGHKRAIAAKKEYDEDGVGDVDVIGYEDGSLKTTAPEEGNRILLEYGLNFLVNEGGPNYVEQRATLPDGRGIVFTVQWRDGKSPTELRAEAEARITTALDTMREAFGRDVDGDDLRSLAGVTDAQGHALSAAALRALAALADGEAPRE